MLSQHWTVLMRASQKPLFVFITKIYLLVYNVEPLKPHYINNKKKNVFPCKPQFYYITGVYRGIHYFSYFCSKT